MTFVAIALGTALYFHFSGLPTVWVVMAPGVILVIGLFFQMLVMSFPDPPERP